MHETQTLTVATRRHVIRPTDTSTQVILPNSQTIRSHKTYLLPHLIRIPEEARIASSFNELIKGALLSIGQLCDHWCIGIFYSYKVDITCNNNIIMTGHHNYTNGSWHTNLWHKLTPTPIQINLTKVNYIVPKTNVEKISRFPHGACGSPAIHTCIRAIKNNFLAA